SPSSGALRPVQHSAAREVPCGAYQGHAADLLALPFPETHAVAGEGDVLPVSSVQQDGRFERLGEKGCAGVEVRMRCGDRLHTAELGKSRLRCWREHRHAIPQHVTLGRLYQERTLAYSDL